MPSGRTDLKRLSTAHSIDNGRWEPESFCRNLFIPAVNAAGFGRVRFHDLRHTFASICSDKGIPVERVSAWMGHSSIVITWTTYTQLFRGDNDHDEIAKLGFQGAARSDRPDLLLRSVPAVH